MILKGFRYGFNVQLALDMPLKAIEAARDGKYSLALSYAERAKKTAGKAIELGRSLEVDSEVLGSLEANIQTMEDLETLVKQERFRGRFSK